MDWRCRNNRLTAGQDAEILKAAENLYLAYYSPQGYFNSEDGDIRLAIYSGDLDGLAGDKQSKTSRRDNQRDQLFLRAIDVLTKTKWKEKCKRYN